MHILACLVWSVGLSEIHSKQVEVEETLVREIFHQGMLRVAVACGVVGMLCLPRCSWCLEALPVEEPHSAGAKQVLAKAL